MTYTDNFYKIFLSNFTLKQKQRALESIHDYKKQCTSRLYGSSIWKIVHALDDLFLTKSLDINFIESIILKKPILYE